MFNLIYFLSEVQILNKTLTSLNYYNLVLNYLFIVKLSINLGYIEFWNEFGLSLLYSS